MNKSIALKNKLSVYFLFIVSFFIIIYLFYFLINGERGIIAYYKINNQNLSHKAVYNELIIQNDKLILETKKLQHNTIDLDFLDEKIRKITGFVKKDELLIIFD